ncbi:hypothetical protein PR048_028584 [Dryococelus australis]|uniref:Uncharacterized protein n=1 Tax=Dryococelus australis TaxID=614101 RepID=A0ABQ9GDM0_9NEOP|nr:hypothetical protein PR048_028584 [Dryococelus australis]
MLHIFLQNTLQCYWLGYSRVYRVIVRTFVARRENYQSTIGSSNFPLKFVSHKWLENVPVAEKSLGMIPKPKKHILHELTSLKLKVFILVAKLLQPFLTAYQTGKPMLFFF